MSSNTLASTTLEEAAKIPGNVSTEIKQFTANAVPQHCRAGNRFGDAIGRRLKLSEVSINKNRDEPSRDEVRVVCEISVNEDMLNGGGALHGGCSAYLVDFCSTLPLMAHDKIQGGSGHSGVSQAINTVYHAPAGLGDELRIVNTVLTFGTRVRSARCEIWNATRHRLVVSGVHIKMNPSAPSPKL